MVISYQILCSRSKNYIKQQYLRRKQSESLQYLVFRSFTKFIKKFQSKRKYVFRIKIFLPEAAHCLYFSGIKSQKYFPDAILRLTPFAQDNIIRKSTACTCSAPPARPERRNGVPYKLRALHVRQGCILALQLITTNNNTIRFMFRNWYVFH